MSAGPWKDQTLIYIHGILNKPPADVLKRLWDQALFHRDLGGRSRMAYWADIRYGQLLPVPEADVLDSGGSALTALGQYGTLSEEDLVVPSDAQDYVSGLAEQLQRREDQLEETWDVEFEGGVAVAGVEARILPGRALRRWVTRRITRAFIQDSAAYFYDSKDREGMRNRLRRLLVPGAGPYVLIAHSQGTIIAYDVLRELEGRKDIDIQAFITLGSPLGIQEVRDNLLKGVEPNGLRMIRGLEARWWNFFDRLDPVALDGHLQDDFPIQADEERGVVDTRVLNRDTLRLNGFNPHSSTGYLSTDEVRETATDLLGPRFGDPVEDFVIARDVAREMNGLAQRIPVLVQLDESLAGETLAEKGETLAQTIRKIVRHETQNMAQDPADELAAVDQMKRFVSARLTAREIDLLKAQAEELEVYRIWRNSERRALLDCSVHTVQAYSARISYGAVGEGIGWAVLDTGIRADHPHFKTHRSIRGVWDSTQIGPVRQVWDGQGEPPVAGEPALTDRHGHGTHVAGVIAGESPQEEDPHLHGIAPRAGLYIFKVLDDQGRGDDSFIIKALDKIADLNESAGRLKIHGVNLSLGGSFDPEVFGCGHSPICREIRRLWRQGVVVCIAAGNEGRTLVRTVGGVQEINLDLSIGDPANLEDAIAVGSVNKEAPHLYGVSYFSSRGPTADGRQKPDVVAPGERILSCNSRFDEGAESENYALLSGTSMACPHVSGMIASFLSVRPGYRGYPDRVKEVLLNHSTNIGRDSYHQGRGLPNLTRMLAAT